ncbi:MAG TPA: TIGR03000 domain-containing protein [Gemmataceae bacterium]|jgi:uncharacterized protein (TIGR03000 family)|nr:TIGR03000 domain-containing protein [Gemmataceae bacterium]
MRHIMIAAAVGALSLFLTNPANAQKGGGHAGGHPGGGAVGHPGGGGVGHPGAGAGAYHGGGGAYHGGGAYYHNGGYYPHYHYGYPGIGIGIGLGYGLGYGAAYPYYDSTPIYVPPVGPTVGPSSYSYYPPDAPVLGSSIAPPAVAPPEAAPAAVNVPADEAYVRVLVPDANAEVLLEGKATDVLGRDRLFSSPKLDPGSKYTYTVTASWLDQGHLVRQTREVALTAGQVSIADFRHIR